MTQDTPNSANSPSTAAASTTAGDIVQVSTVGAVRYITLNRTGAYNSLNQELRLALIEAFRNAQKDSEELGSAVRAVVLRANGKAFCSGQDLKEQLRDTQNRTGMEKVVEEYNPMTELLAGISVPTIAAIQGPAAGAGWGLAMACDFRVMSTAASFKGAFTGVGLAADSGLSQTLVDCVGRAKALQLLLLDRKVPAEEAAELGLVEQLVEPADLEATVEKLANNFAAGPTAAYKEMKALVKNTAAISDAAAAEAEAQQRLFNTADHSEAVAAFLGKRPPQFKGE
ncbi:enoyl-CoA hydratase/isomerase family protein [Corynebacterium jeikeium]|uniref:enoyl-CoA hydratase/isomerase family protein n=1 Tax=Corynebacterium jeikeium TaxID=38289 RepID=UPI000B2957C9|nr:enoyl-CoA hydratase/isomerase family protein [Corynebacterium jeikeium]